MFASGGVARIGLAGALAACALGSSSGNAQRLVATRTCLSQGRSLDSALAVSQASSVLSHKGVTLAPRALQAISDNGVEVGVIIALRVTDPAGMIGGGGLVWVDTETGCPILLRRYE